MPGQRRIALVKEKMYVTKGTSIDNIIENKEGDKHSHVRYMVSTSDNRGTSSILSLLGLVRKFTNKVRCNLIFVII